jgi:hypothetical protein
LKKWGARLISWSRVFDKIRKIFPELVKTMKWKEEEWSETWSKIYTDKTKF